MDPITTTTISKKPSAYFCWTSENSRQLWLSASATNSKQTRAEGCLQVPVDHKDLIQLGRAALNVSHLAHIFPFAQLASVARRNERERKRVRQINSAFSSLRQHVQHRSAKRKLSKAETLRCAIDYINYLRKVLDSKNPSKDSQDEEIDIEIKEDGNESNSTASTEASLQMEDDDKYVQDYDAYHQSSSKFNYEMSPLSAPDEAVNEGYQPPANHSINIKQQNTEPEATYNPSLYVKDYQNDNGLDHHNYRYNGIPSRRSAFQPQMQSSSCLDCINY